MAAATGTGTLDSVKVESDLDSEAGECIKALPRRTVRLIGSAQVITSVVSVVKELVENSLDAGSTSIEVKLESYGFDKIEVRDNGEGIRPSDTPFMGRPHYTSKLSHMDDLSSLQTYGFRGEALGSLCAVSRVSIITKTEADLVGMVYDLDQEGIITNSKPSHLGQGTTVTALQLFHSVPVRRQYYSVVKRRKEELKKVEDIIMAFGLIRHDVRFVLRHNREVVWQKSTVPSSRHVLIQILGSSTVSHLEHRQIHNDPDHHQMKVELYIPKKESDVQKTSRVSNDRSFIFVNGRPVQQKDILKLVKQMYIQATGCESARFPICFISIVIPPQEIDVNLEPNKTKILFQQNSEVLNTLRNMLADVYPCKEPLDITQPLDESRDEENNRNRHSETNGNFNDSSSVSGDTSSIFDVPTVPAPGQKKRTNASVPEVVGVVNTPQKNNPSSTGTTSVPSPRVPSTVPSPAVSTLSDASFLNKEPLLNSTRCDGEQPPVINSQNITFDLNFDQEGYDIFKDLDFENPCDSEKSNTVQVHGQPDIGKVQRGVRPELPLVPMCGMSRNCIVDKPGDTTERDVSLQGKVNEAASNDLMKPARNIHSPVEAGDSWSKGTSVQNAAGTKVMPVQLLLPGAPPPRDLSHSFNTTLNTSATSYNNKTISAADKPGQMTLADVAAMDQIKQPTSGFIEYSKLKRPGIIQDNPDADLREVGKMIAAKWNNLTEAEQNNYEKTRSNESFRNSTARKDTSSIEAGPSVKKRKISNGNLSGRSVIDMLKSPKPVPARKKAPVIPKKTVPVPFSMAELQRKYTQGPIGSQCYKPKSAGLGLLGEVKPAGWWVGLLGNSITAIVPWRIQECLIFHRLMESHSLPTDKLEDPISLTHGNINDSLLQTLVSLEWSKLGLADSYTYCTDPRIEKNGFSIRKSIELDPRIEVISIAKCIPQFGLNDLKDILTRLRPFSSSAVQESRPQKVRHYLQGEAVRMMRQMPARVNREEMYDFLSQLEQKLSNTPRCIHEKPLLHTLYDLQSDSSR